MADEKLIKVLVVDDEYDLMQGAMDFAGKFIGETYSFSVAETADEGLEKLIEIKPDIIFLDKNFADSNKHGVYFLDVIKTVEEYEDYKNIPIIGIGSFYEDERDKLTEYDPKPLSYKNFENMIKKYVKK